MAAIVDLKKVSVPRLAKEWGVSSAKIVAFIRSGELRAVDLATKGSTRPRYLIDRADIASFEAARQVVPDQGEPARKLRRSSAATVEKFF